MNVAAGRVLFAERTGFVPGGKSGGPRETLDDTVIAHPTYGSLGWLAVVNPGPNTERDLRNILRHAWEAARSRFERRAHLPHS